MPREALLRFRHIQAQEVAACETADDVAAALERARQAGLRVAVRSGGHCFAGRSSTEGLLVDVSPMRSVEVGDATCSVGAGAVLGDVYDALDAHGRTIAGGCGPEVGIAGLLLGGGLGILGRRHGLTCDQLVAARVVLADGRVVDCDERRESDLFWALRGAGGGQFGVVTEFTLRTVPAPRVTTLDLVWPLERAAAAIAAWQDWAPDAPDDVAASLVIAAEVHLFGAMAPGGDLDAFVARVGGDPSSASLREHEYRDAKRHLAEHGPAEGPDGHLYTKSEFFRASLPADAIAALLDAFVAPGPFRVLDFSPWGGAYGRNASGAFAHRDARFLLKQDAVVAGPDEAGAARGWLERSWAIVHPYGTGGVYPNFPDPDLEGWARAYHGAGLERLREVKARYDPHAVFSFEQSV
ncbi:MAG TPA: FAD-binding oxidoreductase [Solirubrobacteraceae bacterium]|nr:FAD-binding oxidoreductase [Solirubrobacteraceae bacterium]